MEYEEAWPKTPLRHCYPNLSFKIQNIGQGKIPYSGEI